MDRDIFGHAFNATAMATAESRNLGPNRQTTSRPNPLAAKPRNLVREGPHGTGVLVVFPPGDDITSTTNPLDESAVAPAKP